MAGALRSTTTPATDLGGVEAVLLAIGAVAVLAVAGHATLRRVPGAHARGKRNVGGRV